MQNVTDTSEIDIKTWSQFVEKLLREDTQWPPLLFPSLILIIFTVGFVGNLLTCIVIYYDKTMHTATNCYVFNLAVSDLLVIFAILLGLPEHFGTYTLRHYTFGNLTCKIQFFFVMALWNSGILTMTALAAERYLAICYPLILKATPIRRRIKKVIVIIWIIAIAETIPDVWSVRLIHTKDMCMCFIVPTFYTRITNGVLAVFTFLIPLGIMTCMYVMIGFQMHTVQKNTSKTRIFNKRNNRSKVNRLIIALTLSFLLCWLPFFTMRTLIFVLDADQFMKIDKCWNFWYKITALNAWFSAVLNPLLFSVMSTKFQHALKALWNRKVRRQHPEIESSKATTHE